MKLNLKKICKITAVILGAVILASVVFVSICNIIVVAMASGNILSVDEACNLQDVDCIIILGAKVKSDGSLSTVLEERVNTGKELYFRNASPKILVSGDHGQKDYNEVGAMKAYLVEAGVPKDDIFTDHAGFDTYDSMYRARDIFKAKKVIIVTQKFHISRAVFIAESLGLEAYGVASDENNRYFNFKTEIREIAARTKYVFDAIFKPEPKYLGEAIPIWGEASASDG